MNRTYGQTENCAGCRFWSEMLAMAVSGGPVKAMCLSRTSLRSQQYTAGSERCAAWESGRLGAVDEPDVPDGYYEEAIPDAED